MEPPRARSDMGGTVLYVGYVPEPAALRTVATVVQYRPYVIYVRLIREGYNLIFLL